VGTRSAAAAMIVVLFAGGWCEASAQIPRACRDARSEPAPAGLPRQDTVIWRDVFILSRNIQYWLATYSDTAPSGLARSEQCFRYEVENTGTRDIRQFYWPLAGIIIDPLKAGEPRVSKVAFRPVMEQPIDIVSVLFALENERADTRAHAERHYKDHSHASSTQLAQADGATASPAVQPVHSPMVTLQEPDDVLAGLGNFLQVRGLPKAPFMAVKFSGATKEASTLQDHFSSPGLVLDVSSRAARDGNTISIETKIMMKGTVEEISFSFPALWAWKKLPKPLVDVKKYADFLNEFQKAKYNIVHQRNEIVFKSSVPLDKTAVIYRMEHPILIQMAGQKQCVLVSSYSLSPINFSLDECRSWLRGRPASGISVPGARRDAARARSQPTERRPVNVHPTSTAIRH
jgi:hypothetical protein